MAIGVLAAGVLSVSQSGVQTELYYLSTLRARYMALTGFNYVKNNSSAEYDRLEGLTFTVSDGAGDELGRFTVVDDSHRQWQDPNGIIWQEIQVRGTVNAGSSLEANYIVHNSFNKQEAITFGDDFDAFQDGSSDPGKRPLYKDDVNKRFIIGNNQNYAFGSLFYSGDKVLNSGANPNICEDGRCDLKQGFRLFFVSRYSANAADGLVFTWFGAGKSRYLNTLCSVGGDSALGEMIGYAGDGRVYTGTNGTYGTGAIKHWGTYIKNDPTCKDSPDGSVLCARKLCEDTGRLYNAAGELIGYNTEFRYYRTENYEGNPPQVKNKVHYNNEDRKGIQPPKMGIEFDNWDNTNTGGICQSSTAYNGCRVSYRQDRSGDHIAYIFWGDLANSEPNTFNCVYYHNNSSTRFTDGTYLAEWQGAHAYDDNKHGRGYNDAYGSTGYWQSNFSWLNNTFAFRTEVERSLTPSGGRYEYTIRSWLKRCTTTDCEEYWNRDWYEANGSTDTDNLYFSDTSKFLCQDAPFDMCEDGKENTVILKKTVFLTQQEHDDFDKMIFGFTAATGGATQNATFSQFILQFIRASDYEYDTSGEIIHRRRVHNRKIN